jgi:hypothetical protein
VQLFMKLFFPEPDSGLPLLARRLASQRKLRMRQRIRPLCCSNRFCRHKPRVRPPYRVEI